MEDDSLTMYSMEEDTDCSQSQSLLQIPGISTSPMTMTPVLFEYRREAIESDSKDKTSWIEPATKLLMSLVQEYLPRVGKTVKLKTKKKMWEAIKEVMSKHGYIYSAAQIENKYKSLERSYKNKIQHNKKTGRDRASCSYERELNDIFKGRDNIFPKYILGAAGVGTIQEQLQEEAGINCVPNSDNEIEQNVTSGPQDVDKSLEIDSPEKTPECSPKPQATECSPKAKATKCSPKKNKSLLRELSQIRREKREDNAKKFELQAKKLQAYEERTKQVAEKNSLSFKLKENKN